MSVDVHEADESERDVLRRLMEFYAYDWSELDGRDVDDHGEFGYPWLDHYWTDENRHAFLIRADGKLAGFALVRQEQRTQMAEFFILRRYRRCGLGTASAVEVFHRFPGPWEVMQRLTNPGATAFWRKVIPVRYTETTTDDQVLQTFEIRSSVTQRRPG